MQTFALVWVQVLHVPDEAVGWWGLCGGKLCGWGVVWYPVFCVVLCGSLCFVLFCVVVLLVYQVYRCVH